MKDEKIKKIYNAIINNQKLTSRKLAEIGFNPNEVSFLVSNNIIGRDNDGIFYLSDMGNLFSYGKKLINYNNEEALKCFEKCLELKINVESTLFNLFFLNINKKDYERAFLYFKQNFGDENYINDDKYYLYLLNIVTDLPKEYKQIVDSITFDDICTNDKEQNEIRLLSFNKDFDLAIKKYDEFINKKEGVTFHDIIVKNLLDGCLDKSLVYKHDNKVDNQMIIKTENNSIPPEDELSKFLKTFSDFLLNEDIGSAIKILEEYLRKYNKEEYLFLIIDLIEIRLTYVRRFESIYSIYSIYNIIKKIVNGNFVLNINRSIGLFNKQLMYGNKNLALFYLDILSNAKKINNKYECKLDGYLKGDSINELNIKEYIDSKMDELQKCGIIYLKISNENIRTLLDIIDNMPIYMTMIGYNEIILRWAEFKNKPFDAEKIISLGKEAYNQKNYIKSSYYFKQSLSRTMVDISTYVYLGLSALRQGFINTCITYLTVATRLGSDNSNDFTELINSVVGKISVDEDDKKKYVKAEEFEFNDISTYDDKTVEIAKLINNGLSFNEACGGLDDNTKCLVALNFAIDGYRVGNFELGDVYLTIAEQIKQKSPLVRKKILEIQKNKRFYQNRVDENYEQVIKTFRK